MYRETIRGLRYRDSDSERRRRGRGFRRCAGHRGTIPSKGHLVSATACQNSHNTQLLGMLERRSFCDQPREELARVRRRDGS